MEVEQMSKSEESHYSALLNNPQLFIGGKAFQDVTGNHAVETLGLQEPGLVRCATLHAGSLQ